MMSRTSNQPFLQFTPTRVNMFVCLYYIMNIHGLNFACTALGSIRSESVLSVRFEHWKPISAVFHDIITYARNRLGARSPTTTAYTVHHTHMAWTTFNTKTYRVDLYGPSKRFGLAHVLSRNCSNRVHYGFLNGRPSIFDHNKSLLARFRVLFRCFFFF